MQSTSLHKIIIVITTATLFSLVHFLIEPPTAPAFFYRFAFGLLAGTLYVSYRSIWPVVGLHTGLNVIANGFSDSTWQLGGLMTLSGADRDLNRWANFIILSLAALAFAHLSRDKSNFENVKGETA